ncbi:MAG: PspA/IM30 family protein [Sphingomonadales bacterium]|nr:PspA/IM30 family protein [Sphingomonadales bacterium]
MFQIAIQVRDLISSNVSALVDCATDPARLVKQLRREIEDSIIALRGDEAQARRRVAHLGSELARLDLVEADWEDKAGVAMAGGREDLARAALLERGKVLEQLAQRRQELEAGEAELAELAAAIGALEAKLEEVRAKVIEAGQARAAAAPPQSPRAPAPSAAERKLDRIAAMEQRVTFAAQDDVGASASSVKSEIEAMARETQILAELDALRRKFAPAGKRKG